MIKTRIKGNKAYLLVSGNLILFMGMMAILTRDAGLALCTYINIMSTWAVILAPWRWNSSWWKSFAKAVFAPFTLWREYKAYLKEREEACKMINSLAKKYPEGLGSFKVDPDQIPNSLDYYRDLLELMGDYLERVKRVYEQEIEIRKNDVRNEENCTEHLPK